MATVGASLKLFDNLSKVMDKTQKSMEATLGFTKRLRKEFQKSIVLDINVSSGLKQIEKIKKNLTKLEQAKNGIDIRAKLKFTGVVKQISLLKAQIKDRIGVIPVPLIFKLPKNIEKIKKDLHLSVKPPVPEQPANEKNAKSGGKFSLGGSALKMFGGIMGAASGIIGKLGGGQQIISSTIGGAMEQQTAKDNLSLLSGSDAQGSAIFDQVSKQALKIGQPVDGAMTNTMSFMSNTKDASQLTDLNLLTERLAKLNPEEGSKGAASAVKSFMNGDSSALEEKFNMSGSSIKSSGAMEAGQSGNMDGFISGMDTLLRQSGVTKQAFEKMVNGPAAQWQRATGNLRFSLASAGMGALKALAPLGAMINQAFDSGKLQPFFDIISNGLTLVVQGIMFLVDKAQWLFGVMQDNWPIVKAALIAVALVITGVVLIALFEMALAWIAAAWPILLIIAIVGLLVYAIQSFGVSTGQIVGAVFGFFSALFAYLYNRVAFIWNILASFAEFMMNLLVDPVFAVKKLFYDLQMTFLGHLYNMLVGVEGFAGGFMSTILSGINKVIEGANWLGKAFSKITGKDFEPTKLLDEKNVHAVSDNVKKMMNSLQAPTSDKNVFTVPRMKEMSLKGSFDSGYSTGENIVNKLSAMKLPGLGIDSGGSIPDPGDKTKAFGAGSTIDKVNEVGRIGETVDISSEDLKVMRDIAEMKTIQNFVTLTPTVQVTTGDIHEKADIHEIINGIEDRLAGSISTSAQGVYA